MIYLMQGFVFDAQEQLRLEAFPVAHQGRLLNLKKTYELQAQYSDNYIYYTYIVANNVWIVVWLGEMLVASAVLLASLAVSLAFSLIASCRGLLNAGPYLEENGLKIDIWCNRILIQNGEL